MKRKLQVQIALQNNQETLSKDTNPHHQESEGSQLLAYPAITTRKVKYMAHVRILRHTNLFHQAKSSSFC